MGDKEDKESESRIEGRIKPQMADFECKLTQTDEVMGGWK